MTKVAALADFDVAMHLTDEETIRAFVDLSFADGNPLEIEHALAIAAKAYRNFEGRSALRA
ncbi:helix-turn-helix domain-containing protein [Paraburkholderia jirisanensis]